MSTPVLVGYASRYGSTQEAAEGVVTALCDCGLDGDLQPLRKVKSLAGYKAVVIGAPLFMYHWHKDALRFLSRFRSTLMKAPVAVFALGPVQYPRNEKEWQSARAQLEKELARFGWLKPAAQEIFGGRFDPRVIGYPLRIFAGQVPVSDIRDMAAVRSWATGLSESLAI
jgi:menaquinone-dependent protoporphyrinogen oxidase